jgi:hypothetical protein
MDDAAAHAPGGAGYDGVDHDVTSTEVFSY